MVVSALKLAAARAEIATLPCFLGKKTLENDVLKEAMEIAAAKKWIARSLLLPGAENEVGLLGFGRSGLESACAAPQPRQLARSPQRPHTELG